MQYTTLGKTELQVSVAGLGCGGYSRLGQSTGRSEAQSTALVEQAMDLGVNFIDTARNYRTEAIVGKALKGRNRDELVISTKATLADDTGRKLFRTGGQRIGNLFAEDGSDLCGCVPPARRTTVGLRSTLWTQ